MAEPEPSGIPRAWPHGYASASARRYHFEQMANDANWGAQYVTAEEYDPDGLLGGAYPVPIRRDSALEAMRAPGDSQETPA